MGIAEMLKQRRRLQRMPSPSIIFVIFVLLLYFSIDIWTAKHYLDEADLPRRLKEDLGNEVIEPLVQELDPFTCTQTPQQCSPIPVYGELRIEAYGFSCDKAANSIEQPHPINRRDFEEEFGISEFKDDLKLSCVDFVERRKYLLTPPVADELNFPLAYSIVVHKDPSQVERLVRSIYRSHNHYCIHVDLKSTDTYTALTKYASCFDNVFLIQDRVSVTYAHYTRLLADLKCMEALLERNNQWKYLINLCGQDFPIKTNYQMVKTLKSLYPRQSIESLSLIPGEGKSSRIEKSWVPKSAIQKRPPYFIPHNDWYKALFARKKQSFPLGSDFPLFAGSAYNVFTRQFINWTLTSQVSLQTIDWSRDTYSPDEFIWATFARFDEAPDAVPRGSGFDASAMNTLARIVKWQAFAGRDYPDCTGQWQREVCVFGYNEVGWLLKRTHLFANKFAIDQPDSLVAMQCLEKTLRKMEQMEACGHVDKTVDELLEML